METGMEMETGVAMGMGISNYVEYQCLASGNKIQVLLTYAHTGIDTQFRHSTLCHCKKTNVSDYNSTLFIHLPASHDLKKRGTSIGERA